MGNLVVQVDGLHQGRSINFRADKNNLIQTVERIKPDTLSAATDFDKEMRSYGYSILWIGLCRGPKKTVFPSTHQTGRMRRSGRNTKWTLNYKMRVYVLRPITVLLFDIRVRVKLQGKKGNTKQGWFRVYLEQDDQLQRYESYFLRSGIWVKDVEGHKLRGYTWCCCDRWH